MTLPSQSYTPNLLLRYLTPEGFALVQPHLTRVQVHRSQVMYEADAPIERVYFLEGGIGSVVTLDEGVGEVEVGLFGYEGLGGAPVLMRAERSSTKAVMQVDHATALVIEAAALLRACDRSASLNGVLLRYVQSAVEQAAHTAAANAHFALPERLARWLLMCHDRVEGEEIPLTHEFLGTMLAVRRSGVTVTLHMLEGAGAIRSTRGLVKVLDRQRLEEIAGPAYGAPEAAYRRLIGPFGRSSEARLEGAR